MSTPKTTAMPGTEAVTTVARKVPGYVKGSHAARVRAEQDERRVELLALHDVLSAQRNALDDQLADVGEALGLLSVPIHGNVVPLKAAAE